MGAWGDGLQANDDAQDVIYKFEFEFLGVILAPNPDNVLVMLEKVKEISYYPTGFLGAVEYLMDNIPDISHFVKAQRMLQDSLTAQIEEDKRWRFEDPDNRKKILDLFHQRLQGKPVPLDVIKESNISLEELIERDRNNGAPT